MDPMPRAERQRRSSVSLLRQHVSMLPEDQMLPPDVHTHLFPPNADHSSWPDAKDPLTRHTHTPPPLFLHFPALG